MAQLVAVGGAAISTAIGLGPAVGFAIGSIVGQLLFPEGGTGERQLGPRLGDLSVSSSAYGGAIPIAFGTIRMAGNMIWSTGIEEVKTTKKEGGGKGGSSSSATASFNYFSTFALAFCEGPAEDILRIWADGKLIYDKTQSNDNITKINLNFRFHAGSETQEPDGLIVSDRGVNQTPAFRGICYIVFDRMPLLDFGNRVPFITAEVTFDFTGDQTSTPVDPADVPGGATSFRGNSLAPDYNRGVFYAVQSSATVGSNWLRRIKNDDMEEDRQQNYILDALGNDVQRLRIMAVLVDGKIILSTGGSGLSPIHAVNPDSMQIFSTFGSDIGTGSNNTSQRFERCTEGKSTYVEVLGLLGLEHYVFTGSKNNSAGLLKVTDIQIAYVWDSDTSPGQPEIPLDGNNSILGTSPGATGQGFGEAYMLAGVDYDAGPSGADIQLYKIRVTAGARFDIGSGTSPGVAFTHVNSIPTSAFGDIGGSFNLVIGLIYDKTDDTIMMQFEDSTGKFFMSKILPSVGVPIWTTEIPTMTTQIGGWNNSRILNGIYGQIDGDRTWALFTSTGEIFHNQPGASPPADSDNAKWWDSGSNTSIGDADGASLTKWFFFRGGAGGPALLDDVVRGISERTGLASADIDVSGLVTKQVPGYVLSRQTSARNAIENLAAVFFFDGVESDYVLKYSLRSTKVTTATIPQRDLAPLGDDGEFFLESRTQEIELPTRWSITYMNKDKDYLQAVHSSQRILSPTPTMNSRNEMGNQVPAAMSSEFVKQSSEQALYTAWTERSTYSVRVPWTYLAMDPGDQVEIALDDGTLFTTRMIGMDIGQELTIDLTALSSEAAQYNSTVDADEGDSGDVQTLPSAVITRVILLCSPLLRDSDDVGRVTSAQYFLMGSFGLPGWIAGTLFKSADGIDFADVGSIINEMSWGTAITVLGDDPDPFSTDEINTLRVHMQTGVENLVSITQLEMVNGGNPCALIHQNGVDVEILQFRTVVVNADGSRSLTGLLRGRRGSEVFTPGHTIGDLFVLLDPSTAAITPLALGELNQTRFYKGISSGQLFEEAPLVTKVSPGNDLKPYAVVSQLATANVNDLDLTWVRRTRVGGALQNGAGTVPVSEDSEEYEIDILDGPAGSIVRTVLALSTPAFTYTSADQTTDGFSPPLSQLTVRIYQISAQVGRGFTKEVTLDVK